MGIRQVRVTNLIPNPSFEQNASWSGIVYDASQSCYGGRSCKFPAGQSTITSCPMPKPILNHTYYGKHYKKTNGQNNPADCRFEWFAGDGVGLNWVFGWNNGNYPSWGTTSAVHTITVLNASSFVCRNFVVNSTVDMWVDGLLIIDLTASFGVGKEPSKEWCDNNISFFEGSGTLTIVEEYAQIVTTCTPSMVEVWESTKIEVAIGGTMDTMKKVYPVCGTCYSGQGVILGQNWEVAI